MLTHLFKSGVDSLRYYVHSLRHSRRRWTILLLHSSLPADVLRAFFVAAKSHFRLVSLAEGIELLRVAKMDRPAISFTYDDADLSVFTDAMPLHVEHSVPACIFACTGFINAGRRYQTRDVSRPVMSWEQLNEWVAQGFEVGAHTVNHIPLNQATLGRAQREILESAAELSDRCACAVRFFASPWGLSSPDVSTWLERESSFDGIFTVDRRDVLPGHQGKHFPRKAMGANIRNLQDALADWSLVAELRAAHYRRVVNGQAPVVFTEDRFLDDLERIPVDLAGCGAEPGL